VNLILRQFVIEENIFCACAIVGGSNIKTMVWATILHCHAQLLYQIMLIKSSHINWVERIMNNIKTNCFLQIAD